MSRTKGLSLEELKAKQNSLREQGKSLSTSKEMGKLEDAIKVLQPERYNAGTVSQAQAKLSSSTQTGLGSGSNLSALESQLAAKQAALIKATKNLNDNPWYSEATRVGKLAKLNNIAQLEISNINDQIAQARASEQQAFENNITTQELALKQEDKTKTPSPKGVTPKGDTSPTSETAPMVTPVGGAGTIMNGWFYTNAGWISEKESITLAEKALKQQEGSTNEDLIRIRTDPKFRAWVLSL